MSAAVRLEIGAGARPRRRHAAAALLAAPLGVVGPLVLWPALVLHVALPPMTAGHLASPGGRARFAAEDRPRIAEGLEWLLGLYGWASLAAPRPPWAPGPRAVRLHVPAPQADAPPGPGAALARLVTALPAAAAALVAGALALGPWLALVLCLLVTGRAPALLRRPQARALGAQAAALARQAGLSSAGPSASSRSTGTGRTSTSIIGQWRSASAARTR